MPRERDPDSRAYDPQIIAYLSSALFTFQRDGEEFLTIRGGAISRENIATQGGRGFALMPGSNVQAWVRSLYYNFRLMYGPVNDNGKPLRVKLGPNSWGYAPMPYWLHIIWLDLEPLGLRGRLQVGPRGVQPPADERYAIPRAVA